MKDGQGGKEEWRLEMYFSKNVLLQLENLAINDVLTMKAARRDAIANLKCFGALGL